MKKIFVYIIISFFTSALVAQELDCRINVSAARLQTADPQIFKTLTEDLTKFMNDRKWTQHTYEDDEKIECTFNIIITEEESSDRYKAQVTIQANRPVYNSDYKTALLNYNDDRFVFQYVQSQPMDFNQNDIRNELTGFMAYYAYVIIGLDFDSYSHKGGEPYFLKAQNIINNFQNPEYNDGWKPFSTTINRYWFMENLLNIRYKIMRDVNYNYHIKGLDKMYEDPIAGKEQVINVIESLDKLYRQRPNLMISQLFFKAKSNEIIQILQNANSSEKIQVVGLLQKLDPANTSRYQQLMRGISGGASRNANSISIGQGKRGR